MASAGNVTNHKPESEPWYNSFSRRGAIVELDVGSRGKESSLGKKECFEKQRRSDGLLGNEKAASNALRGKNLDVREKNGLVNTFEVIDAWAGRKQQTLGWIPDYAGGWMVSARVVVAAIFTGAFPARRLHEDNDIRRIFTLPANRTIVTA